jgi:hypothetical protein
VQAFSRSGAIDGWFYSVLNFLTMIFVSYDFCLYHSGDFCPFFGEDQTTGWQRWFMVQEGDEDLN